MMQLWKRLFGTPMRSTVQPSSEEALLHLEIFDLRQCYEFQYVLEQDRTALNHVLAEFDVLLNSKDSLPTKMMRESGWSACDTLATALAGFAIEELLSGKRHYSTGQLDELGDAFFRVFDHCLITLVNSGKLTLWEAEQEALELRETIAALGRELKSGGASSLAAG